MLDIQDNLNKKLNPDWRNADYMWTDAITVEAVELFDHLNWKWWKQYKSSPDWDQIRMEAVDIWHFVMSALLKSDHFEEILGYVAQPWTASHFVSEAKRQEAATKAARCMIAVASGSYSLEAILKIFKGLCNDLTMTLDDLYRLYVGKAKLNELRWANGYGTTYIKNWNGKEDNQVLTEIVNSLNVDSPTFAEDVFKELSARYADVVASTETFGANNA